MSSEDHLVKCNTLVSMLWGISPCSCFNLDFLTFKSLNVLLVDMLVGTAQNDIYTDSCVQRLI